MKENVRIDSPLPAWGNSFADRMGFAWMRTDFDNIALIANKATASVKKYPEFFDRHSTTSG